MKIFITGISSGIGLGLAGYYLDEGHTVYGISRNSSKELEHHKNFNYLSVDLAELDKIEEKITPYLASTSHLDLVILNAGILPQIADMRNTSLKEIKKVMDVNVWANKVLLDAIIEKAPPTQVVAISSGAAVSGARGWNAYSLSKATLNMLVNLYAKEEEHTHFIAMAPGIIDTSMQEYISGLPDDVSYPVVEKLKKARGTPQMPPAKDAAPLLAKAFERARREYPSGDFVDIRKMD